MHGKSMRSTYFSRGEAADGQTLHKSSMKSETLTTARTRRGFLHEKGLRMAMTAWLGAMLFGEIAVFVLVDCSWPSNLRDAGRQGGGRLLVMADMQLSDFGSYSFAPAGSLLLWLIERANDAFVRYAVAPVTPSCGLWRQCRMTSLRCQSCMRISPIVQGTLLHKTVM